MHISNCARRDADGITALLEVLVAPQNGPALLQRALRTLAFLASSPLNAAGVVALRGASVIVPLLGSRHEGVVTGAAALLRPLLALPAGRVRLAFLCCFVHSALENGMQSTWALLMCTRCESSSPGDGSGLQHALRLLQDVMCACQY